MLFRSPPRIDQDLQRARLYGLMHHYADRAHSHALIDDDRIGDTHRYIERLEEQRENAKVSLRGYSMSSVSTVSGGSSRGVEALIGADAT